MTSKSRKEKQKEVFARDGFKCVKCGETSGLTLDHIMPRSDGGSDELANLQTLCLSCNGKKGNYVKLGFWERVRFIWNVNERIQSIRVNMRSEISIETERTKKTCLQSFDDKAKFLQGATLGLGSRIDTLNSTLTEAFAKKAKEDALLIVGMENDIDILKKDLAFYKEGYQKDFNQLLEYLDLQYVPETVKQIEVIEKKLVEVVEPATFMKSE